MSQYMIAVYNNPGTRLRPAEEMAPIYEAVDAVNQKMVDAGVFVFAGGMHDQASSTVVDARSGSPVVTDGPYIESKEYVGGFWVIEVADMDAALDWTKQAAVACGDPLELRPFMDGPPEGADA